MINIKKVSKALTFRNICKNELVFRQYIKSKDLSSAYIMLTNIFQNSTQQGHCETLATVCIALFDYTNAYKAAIRAYEIRCNAADTIGGADISYPVKETHIIEQSVETQGNYEVEKYTEWLTERLNACKNKGRYEDVQRIKNTLSREPFSSFVKHP